MVEPEDEEIFKEYFNKLVRDKEINPSLWLAHDEFNEFQLKWEKGGYTLTTETERENAKAVGRCRRVHTSRQTVTMGFIMSATLGICNASS